MGNRSDRLQGVPTTESCVPINPPIHLEHRQLPTRCISNTPFRHRLLLHLVHCVQDDLGVSSKTLRSRYGSVTTSGGARGRVGRKPSTALKPNHLLGRLTLTHSTLTGFLPSSSLWSSVFAILTFDFGSTPTVPTLGVTSRPPLLPYVRSVLSRVELIGLVSACEWITSTVLRLYVTHPLCIVTLCATMTFRFCSRTVEC